MYPCIERWVKEIEIGEQLPDSFGASSWHAEPWSVRVRCDIASRRIHKGEAQIRLLDTACAIDRDERWLTISVLEFIIVWDQLGELVCVRHRL